MVEESLEVDNEGEHEDDEHAKAHCGPALTVENSQCRNKVDRRERRRTTTAPGCCCCWSWYLLHGDDGRGREDHIAGRHEDPGRHRVCDGSRAPLGKSAKDYKQAHRDDDDEAARRWEDGTCDCRSYSAWESKGPRHLVTFVAAHVVVPKKMTTRKRWEEVAETREEDERVAEDDSQVVGARHTL